MANSVPSSMKNLATEPIPRPWTSVEVGRFSGFLAITFAAALAATPAASAACKASFAPSIAPPPALPVGDPPGGEPSTPSLAMLLELESDDPQVGVGITGKEKGQSGTSKQTLALIAKGAESCRISYGTGVGEATNGIGSSPWSLPFSAVAGFTGSATMRILF